MEAALQRAGLRRALPAPLIRRHLRERLGLTQTDLAAELKVDRVTISRWETGTRTPRGRNLQAYAAVLERLLTDGGLGGEG
jgi:transcriptional regulator with XRE-family HTH domain